MFKHVILLTLVLVTFKLLEIITLPWIVLFIPITIYFGFLLTTFAIIAILIKTGRIKYISLEDLEDYVKELQEQEQKDKEEK